MRIQLVLEPMDDAFERPPSDRLRAAMKLIRKRCRLRAVEIREVLDDETADPEPSDEPMISREGLILALSAFPGGRQTYTKNRHAMADRVIRAAIDAGECDETDAITWLRQRMARANMDDWQIRTGGARGVLEVLEARLCPPGTC